MQGETKEAPLHMHTFEVIHIEETDSTNRWLAENVPHTDAAVWTDYQTAGRGCGTNRWESERGKNLLFSVLFHSKNITAKYQYAISMAMALAIHDAVKSHIPAVPDTNNGADARKPLQIKWPNDIYWQDRKLCGILIENKLSGTMVKESIIGVGLNVNQQAFLSDAPNPVSLYQITGQELSRSALLNDILQSFSRRIAPVDSTTGEAQQDAFNDLRYDYVALLYRQDGFFPYSDANGSFQAEFETIEDSGMIVLRDTSNHLRRYAFKEVQYII